MVASPRNQIHSPPIRRALSFGEQPVRRLKHTRQAIERFSDDEIKLVAPDIFQKLLISRPKLIRSTQSAIEIKVLNRPSRSIGAQLT